MPDLKANISEENLLALTSSSGNSSDDTTGLNLNRDDDASQSCQEKDPHQENCACGGGVDRGRLKCYDFIKECW